MLTVHNLLSTNSTSSAEKYRLSVQFCIDFVCEDWERPRAHCYTCVHVSFCVTENYWRCLIRSASLLPLSHMEAEKREMEEADTVSALASLSVAGEPQHRFVGQCCMTLCVCVCVCCLLYTSDAADE